MNTPDFDRYAEDYRSLLDSSVRLSGYGAAFFADRKAREIARTLSAHSISTTGLRLLNFGCGIGTGEPALAQHLPGSSIFSVDVSRKSIEVARERNKDLLAVQFSDFDGRHIPFPGPFDAILLAGVLHHIPPSDHRDILYNLRKELSPQGLLFVFEHNPWNPLTRKAVRDCPFDADAKLIPQGSLRSVLHAAGFERCDIRFIHFFPHLFRILLPIEHLMSWLPLGAQYYCVASRDLTAEANVP
ncbi:MAG: class I SAM-dependent methyltransferase [Nitrospirota bacterium]|nr:class I SAM-dependent methyltransferase [Nitrospirota bacterium]